MFMFAITGFTLNHARDIEAKPRVISLQATVPATVLEQIQVPDEGQERTPLPRALQVWARTQWGIDTRGREAEWSDGEIYLAMPRPGGDAWMRVSLPDGDAEYENTDRGWISYFNDLHKGRNTGAAWKWLIDLFALACLIFTVTGFFILKMHAGNRPLTWPMVGLGLLLPALLALLFVH